MRIISRVALAVAAIGTAILGLAGPASASATGNVNGSVYGSQFTTHFKASGGGLQYGLLFVGSLPVSATYWV